MFWWDWDDFQFWTWPAMSVPVPDGYVLHLPTRAPQPHVLGEAVTVPPHRSISGYEQREKTCARCGAVRVLVMPPKGEPWREWRERDAVTQSRWPAVCEVVQIPTAMPAR